MQQNRQEQEQLIDYMGLQPKLQHMQTNYSSQQTINSQQQNLKQISVSVSVEGQSQVPVLGEEQVLSRPSTLSSDVSVNFSNQQNNHQNLIKQGSQRMGRSSDIMQSGIQSQMQAQPVHGDRIQHRHKYQENEQMDKFFIQNQTQKKQHKLRSSLSNVYSWIRSSIENKSHNSQFRQDNGIGQNNIQMTMTRKNTDRYSIDTHMHIDSNQNLQQSKRSNSLKQQDNINKQLLSKDNSISSIYKQPSAISEQAKQLATDLLTSTTQTTQEAVTNADRIMIKILIIFCGLFLGVCGINVGFGLYSFRNVEWVSNDVKLILHAVFGVLSMLVFTFCGGCILRQGKKRQRYKSKYVKRILFAILALMHLISMLILYIISKPSQK